MLNGALLTITALTVLISMAAAKDQKKKEECPTLNLGEIEDLVRKSPTCRRSVAVFELCEVGPAVICVSALRSPKNARRTFWANCRPHKGVPMTVNRNAARTSIRTKTVRCIDRSKRSAEPM